MPDDRKLPLERVPVPEAWDFSSPKKLAPLTDLDHDFTEGDVDVVLHWPGRGLRLLIDADPMFRHIVVFVPPDRDYVCVEPVTHVANAVNMMASADLETGLQVLEPGETLYGTTRFRVIA